MDIIEDLDLTGDLPEGFQFSLDDILEEYKTPKARSSSSRPADTKTASIAQCADPTSAPSALAAICGRWVKDAKQD